MININSPMVYELRKPPKVSPTKKYPALFLMHGKGAMSRTCFH